MISPSPLQSGQAVWKRWIMGPIWRIMVLMPLPSQPVQRRTAPSLPPRPSHLGQMMARSRASLETLPR